MISAVMEQHTKLVELMANCMMHLQQDCHIIDTLGGLGFGQIYAGTKEGWAQIQSTC
jgi:hypothetical protein